MKIEAGYFDYRKKIRAIWFKPNIIRINAGNKITLYLGPYLKPYMYYFCIFCSFNAIILKNEMLTSFMFLP